MIYGIILDSARDSVVYAYGENKWKRIVRELKLPSDTFELFTPYDEKIIMEICECLVDILHEGSRNTYLEFFGQDFFRYFITLGYHRLFRVAGRSLREFLFVIDQLHDSNRYTFPGMKQPLFHVTGEDEKGAILEYKSTRLNFTYYAVGSLFGVAKILFNENNIKINIRDDLSTREYTHVVIHLEFDNQAYQGKPTMNYPTLPNLTGPTFFKVFPFSILMDSSLRILQMGKNLRKVFPKDTVLIARPLDEVFRLIRPSINIEWNKLPAYGRHIVVLMENRLPLRIGTSGRIRLKGQMKYMESKNMLWFLCHPVLGSTDDMISAGLHVTDLNLFDGTGEFLVANVHQMREMEETIEKQKRCATQLQETGSKLIRYRKRTQHLLNLALPKHIVTMIQAGITAYGLCESYPSITVLFASIMDFKAATALLKPDQIVGLLNSILNIFDDIAEKFDVFKMKTKMDASFMIAAGLHDRSNILENKFDSSLFLTLLDDQNKDNHQETLHLNPTEIIAYLSLELLQASEQLINPLTRKSFGIKIGFHVGPSVGGIIGDQHLQYCLFGDAVNTARLMMTTGESGRIQLTHAAYLHLIQNDRFIIEYRDETRLKNNDSIATYWLMGISWNSSHGDFHQMRESLQRPSRIRYDNG